MGIKSVLSDITLHGMCEDTADGDDPRWEWREESAKPTARTMREPPSTWEQSDVRIAIGIGINITQAHPYDSGRLTVPEGTGSLRGIRPDHLLRDVDDDHTIAGDDRQTEAAVTALGDDHNDPFHLLPGGSAYAVRAKSRHMRTSRLLGDYCNGIHELNLSFCNRLEICNITRIPPFQNP